MYMIAGVKEEVHQTFTEKSPLKGFPGSLHGTPIREIGFNNDTQAAAQRPSHTKHTFYDEINHLCHAQAVRAYPMPALSITSNTEAATSRGEVLG